MKLVSVIAGAMSQIGKPRFTPSSHMARPTNRSQMSTCLEGGRAGELRWILVASGTICRRAAARAGAGGRSDGACVRPLLSHKVAEREEPLHPVELVLCGIEDVEENGDGRCAVLLRCCRDHDSKVHEAKAENRSQRLHQRSGDTGPRQRDHEQPERLRSKR